MLQQILDFWNAHSGMLAAAVVGVLDLLFALNKNWESNGILHWLYSFFSSAKQPPAPPAV